MHIKRAGVTVPVQEKESGGPIIPVWIIRKLKRPSEQIGAGNKCQVNAKLHFFEMSILERLLLSVSALSEAASRLLREAFQYSLSVSLPREDLQTPLTFFSPRLEKMKRDRDERLGAMRERCTFPEVEIRLRRQDCLYAVKKNCR